MKLLFEDLIKQMTLEEKASLMSGKDFWQTQNIDRLNIQSIFLADGPHGIRKQAGEADHLGLNESIKATCFPTASAMANTFNLELANKMAKSLGKEAASQNVNILLGPGMNIKRNSRCGRNFEYFSEDPYLTGKIASEYVKGIQSNGVSACIKHFAANNQETRRMVYDSIIDERALREIYLTGFEIAVKEANPLSIMTSYNKLNGSYTNENEHLLCDILRKEWNYQNLIVTDWGGCNDRVEGIKCTNALEMPTNNGETDLDIINAVKNGNLDEAILDQRVDELLKIIYNTEIKEPVEFDIDQHHELAKECALESMVLLKNENNVLPLDNNKKIAFIGDFFKNPRYQGAGSSIVNPTKLDNLIDILNEQQISYLGFERGYNRYGKKNYLLAKKAIDLANKSDIIVYAMGLDEITEAEGMDRENICIKENQINLLKELHKLNKKIVIVLYSGSVIDLSFDIYADSVLHAYLTGQASSKALIDILFGKVSPSGRLAESYPIKYNDISSSETFPQLGMTVLYKESIYVGYRYLNLNQHKIKYPFGYGLSYSAFNYSDLQVSNEGVTFKIKNIGNIKASEVAQLYIGKKDSNIYRSAPELKGFKKILLEPNEEKEIYIPFDEYSFRYFNPMKNRFEVEEGIYQIYIGKNSIDFVLNSELEVQGITSQKIDYIYNQNVSDEEFERLIGRKIPKQDLTFIKKKRIIVDYNTTVLDLKYACGFSGRLFSWAIRTAVKFLKFIGKKELANTIIMGVYNNPMRGMSRMSGGMISYKQLDGLITMFNGKFFKGLKQFFKAGKTKYKKGGC